MDVPDHPRCGGDRTFFCCWDGDRTFHRGWAGRNVSLRKSKTEALLLRSCCTNIALMPRCRDCHRKTLVPQMLFLTKKPSCISWNVAAVFFLFSLCFCKLLLLPLFSFRSLVRVLSNMSLFCVFCQLVLSFVLLNFSSFYS